MRKRNATTNAAPATPAFNVNETGGNLGTAPATPAKPKRGKAATAAPVATPKPERVKPATFGGFSLGNINRTAATVVAQRTHFGAVTARDEQYIRLYADAAAKADDKRTVTLQALAAYTVNPHYPASRKPHDAGALNRAIAAKHVTVSGDGLSFTLTDTGAALARAVIKRDTAKPTA